MNIYKLNYDVDYSEIGYNSISIKEKNGALCELYISERSCAKPPKWSWIIDEFEEDRTQLQTMSNPGAIVKINIQGEIFLISFGNAHFKINKHVDCHYPLAFLKRVEIRELKNAGLSNPGSNQYKHIVLMHNETDNFLFSENAVEKVKFDITDVDRDLLNLKGNVIEVGNSIKVNCEKNLEDIVNCLENINEIKKMRKEKRKVSEYENIQDKEVVQKLIDRLKNKEFDVSLRLNEAELYGTYYAFQDDVSIKLKFGNQEQKLVAWELPNDLVLEQIHNMKIIFEVEGDYKFSDKLMKHIYVEIQEENIVLMNGKWYKYNDDYVEFINSYLDQNPICYLDSWDWIDEMNNEETDIKKPYKEYKYNYYKSNNDDNLILFDRKKIDNSAFEPCDLYDTLREECIYVKFGNASSKLSYNVQQSQYILNNYAKLKKEFSVEGQRYSIKGVTLVFIIEKSSRYSEYNGIIAHREIKMAGLKRDIVSWFQLAHSKNIEARVIIGYKERNE